MGFAKKYIAPCNDKIFLNLKSFLAYASHLTPAGGLTGQCLQGYSSSALYKKRPLGQLNAQEVSENNKQQDFL